MSQTTGVDKQTKPRFKFIGETISELKKVVWLSRREQIYLTILVILLAVTVGIILGAFDYGFAWIAEKVFIGG